MGKSLIIKDADFSQNGMQESVITLDKSELYSYNNVLITGDNYSEITTENRAYYYVRYSDNVAIKGHSIVDFVFTNMFEVNDYTELEVHLNSVRGNIIPNVGCQFSIAFADSNGEIIKAYINENSSQSGEIYEKIEAPFNATIKIPENAVTAYIVDTINSSDDFASHKAILKKYSLQ